ncbi:GNAT family N-acetyltransferase [Streptomyces albus subsp. chlorinus]|uniref:GNAT family N-acetyltransferase n=1 Tax=Streptomyces albus TaxID=1888 RepID=UPI001570E241|nr:GNAT family N-acetyltransferase [Streptomyces albus]NSC20127.1 GNAT family N-acetyltransferase [Streptomyces albus subsp. chlorinus]
MAEAVRVRRIAPGDWDAIVELERDAYAPLGLSEGRAALQDRASVSPGTCFLLDVGSRCAGYALALPCPPFHYPELGRREGAGPMRSGRGGGPGREEGAGFRTGNLHLHDIVVARPLRRRGLAQVLLRHLGHAARARGDARLSLIAVGGSAGFWSARGFVPHPRVLPPGSGYGTDAVYMSKPVPPGRTGPPATGSAPQRRPSPHHEVS